MRKGFTLIEMIFVIVISSALAIGTFKAIQALYVRSAKAQAVTELSLQSQIVLDQISSLLYNRIPNSVIGYTTTDNSCESITQLTANKEIVEWLATMDDELLQGDYDGFIDLGNSKFSSKFLSTRDIKSSLNSTDVNLIFSGSFAQGSEESTKACTGAYGWHGNDSDLSFDATIEDDKVTITGADQPEYIYEKYYLTKTAYAIARGENLVESDLLAKCSNYKTTSNNFNTTLFLFHDYQPFKGETFCGDSDDSHGNRAGEVSILSEDVNAFETKSINDFILLSLDMNRSIRGSTVVHIAKQKAVY